MNVTLFNFGSNERIVHDGKAIAKSIGIGQSVTIDDLPDVYYHLIKKGMDMGEPLVILQDGEDASVELSAVAALLANIENVDFDLLLTAYHRIIPVNMADRKPNRGTMRTNLEEAGRLIHAGKELPKGGFQKKVEIKEEGDPDKLKEELDRSTKKTKAADDTISRDAVGAALGLGTAAPPKEAKGKGEAGNDETKKLTTKPPRVKPKAAAAKSSEKKATRSRKRA